LLVVVLHALALLLVFLPAFFSALLPASLALTGRLDGVVLSGGTPRDFLLLARLFALRVALLCTSLWLSVFMVRMGFSGVLPLQENR
jgi:hypothetical protein